MNSLNGSFKTPASVFKALPPRTWEDLNGPQVWASAESPGIFLWRLLLCLRRTQCLQLGQLALGPWQAEAQIKEKRNGANGHIAVTLRQCWSEQFKHSNSSNPHNSVE